jgi:polyisoprenoid-binding protein YceI
MKKITLLLTLLLVSTTAQAVWQLDNSQSWLSFLSIKKQDIAELGVFKQLAGGIDDQGLAEIKIDLTSVDTKIEIRDERMQKFLFNTDVHAHAILSTQLDMEKIEQLAVGQMTVLPLTVQLELHGVKQEIEGNVVVFHLTEQQVLVVNQTVLFVNAADFQLLQGIEKLRELAGLPSISKAVPVNFVFTFKQQD